MVCGSAVAQTLEVSPAKVLRDEQAVIRATGLKPGTHVALDADLVDGDTNTWTSHAEFVVDPTGVVDTSKQAPVNGSYKTVSAMGPIWSMRPGSGSHFIDHYVATHGPQIVNFHLMVDGKEAATAELKQVNLGEGVQQVKLTGALHGFLYLPPGAEKHAAFIVLGGSEGGVPALMAAWLANHGYVALALAYFHYEDLPATMTNIPLEYFGSALAMLMNRPDVDKAKIGIVGASRGGELALQLASMYQDVHAVVAFVPADIRFPSCCRTGPSPVRNIGTPQSRFQPAWVFHGQVLPYFIGGQSAGPSVDRFAAMIHVEQIKGPILLVSGQDDMVWESHTMTNNIEQTLKTSHFKYPVVHLDYAHAGHHAGHPGFAPLWTGAETKPTGGTIEDNAASIEDATPKLLDFLAKALPAGPAVTSSMGQ